MNTRTLVFGMALGLMLMPSFLFGQKNVKPSQPAVSWQKEWKQADSLADQGLPKSAMEIVEKIYTASKSGKDIPQFIKAVIYKIRLNSFFREDFLVSTITDLENEVKLAQEPSKQILESILAEVYAKYYQNNQYRFNERSRLANVKADSLQTWDLNMLMQAIYGNYLASLKNDGLLKSVSILDYKAIIEVPESGFGKKASKTNFENAITLRPSLYDFLANRALDFFTSSEGPKNKSANGFRMDNAFYFAQAGEFVKLSTASADSLSPGLQALRIFQRLEAFHLDDKNPAALIDAELARFAFVNSSALTGNNDSLFLDALTKAENRFRESPWSANISFVIAQYYLNRGNRKEGDAASVRYDVKKALEICEAVIKRYPGSEGAGNCRIMAETIRNSEFEIVNESVVSPNLPSLALVSYKNLKQIYLKVFKVEQGVWEPKKEKLKKEQLIQYLLIQQLTKSWEQALPDFGDFRKHSIETMLPVTVPGLYVILACTDTSFSPSSKLISWSDYAVSSINYTSKRNSNGSISLYIFNRETGLASAGITVEVWVKNYNYKSRDWESKKINTFTTGNKGIVTLPTLEKGAKNNNLYCKLIYADDVLVTSAFYQYPVSVMPERTTRQTSFFTDRAIYRPGQTVYYKGILMEIKGESRKLITKENTRVTFTDANGRKLGEQDLFTNEFGSFNGSFVAPRDVLPGQMYISNESGSISFSVEEYKRPTFEVSFEPLEGSYRLNETLTVKGKAVAYAGNAIGQAEVTYRVVRNTRFPWWEWWYIPFPTSPETEITNGVVKTGSDGSFSIQFKAVPDESAGRNTNPVFDYTIKTDVMDVNGETQSSEQTVSVGYNSLVLSVNAGKNLNLQTDSLVTIRAANLNGRPTPVKTAVTVYRLNVPERVFLNRYWEKPDTSLTGETQFKELFPGFSYGNESDTASWKPTEAIVNKVIDLASDSVINIRSFTDYAGKPRLTEPGVYELLLSADDVFGEKVSLKKYFTIYDPSSAGLPGSPVNWFVPLKTKANPGESVGFLVGSKEPNVNLMYEVCAGDSVVLRRWVLISGFQMQIDVPVLETYRGNFSVNFVFAKSNRVFQNSQLIAVPYASDKLNIVVATFRNRILPGQKEEWKIRILDAAKKPASAEFLASMYDASLDAFKDGDWSFDIAKKFFGANPWDISSGNLTRSGSAYGTMSFASYSEHQYPQLNWFGMNYFGGRPYPMMMKSGRADRDAVFMEDKAVMVTESDEMSGVPPPPPPPESVPGNDDEKAKPAKEKQGLQIRRDFRETAFFYPSLVTDSAGNISLSFTAPESLTRWKFRGFAHNTQLEYSLIEKELVTSKDLMVMPNTPRFVRQGDRLVFSCRVVNLSARDLNASVQLELFDGISMKPLGGLVSGPLRLEVAVGKGESAGISWNVNIPEDPLLSLLQYRITAEAGAFSDGEEKLIPVLPNRMMVTESMPLPVRDKGTTDFSFDKLLNSSAETTLKNYRLTLEFASNPAWYAIQALPALNEKEYEDAYSVFGAFYSNSIAAHIMTSDPKIRAVFESWKNLSPDALLSNLEKNSELKSLLLQQTPWVAEAKTETENRRRLGMYFDPDNLNRNLKSNLERLQKLQTAGGGWTWFERMPESRFMSQAIVGGLGHLEQLGVKIFDGDPKTKQMLQKGVQYMDEAFSTAYQEMKRRYPARMKDNNLGSLEVQYLYARSYFMQGQPLQQKLDEPLNYYLGQASQYWIKQDLATQAMLALALERFGKKDVSASIMKSLAERALHSPELGMYWAQDQGYYWHQAPIETQALLIEAFDKVAQAPKQVDEMKIWLLKQKQTTSWKSPRATVEACYALLLRGTGLLTEDPKVKISVGKVKIDQSKLADIKQEAGTGYFRMSWSGSEITPDMGKVRISKSSDGIAWGALYWQYFENMDKITKAATSLKLDKKVFLEKNTASGPVLEAIADGAGLKTGDRLKVRIVLTTDRDLEFVHMGDQRASAFEPLASNTLSGYRYQDGLGYYQSTTDVSTDFFFDYIGRGTYVFEYSLIVNTAGDYTNGITTIQCMYAPEFSAHSEGIRVNIK